MRHELAFAIGKTIARWRTSQGFTQEQLALVLDVDPVTVSRFERGVTLPSLTTLQSIASTFGLSLSRLLDEIPEEISKVTAEMKILNSLMESLSDGEKTFILDTVKRYCSLKTRQSTP